MRIFGFFTSLLLILWVTSSVFAADICAKNPQSTYDMKNCYGNQIQIADKALNLAYKNVLNTFSSPRQKTTLIQAESDWIKFRDSECTFERLIVEGGTAEPLFEDRCVLELTQARTNWLKKLIDYNH